MEDELIQNTGGNDNEAKDFPSRFQLLLEMLQFRS